MNRVKLGVVGLNRGASLAEALRSVPDAQLAAICDADHHRLDAFHDALCAKGVKTSAFADFDALLSSDIDAVLIATGAPTHAALSARALEAGKHVLSEIPAVDSLEEAAMLAEACRAHPKQTYMLAENCCFWSFVGTWKSLVERGELGEVYYAEAEYLHNVTALMRDESGRPTWRASYDAIKYLTHDLGPLLYMLNDRVTSVSCFAPEINSAPGVSTGTPDEVAIFRTKKGALIKILVSFGVARPAIHNYCLYGTRGTLETDRVNAYATNACLKSFVNLEENLFRLPTTTNYPGYEAGGHGGADVKMLEAFVSSLTRREAPPIDVAAGLNMTVPGICAHMSAMLRGQSVEIPQFDGAIMGS